MTKTPSAIIASFTKTPKAPNKQWNWSIWAKIGQGGQNWPIRVSSYTKLANSAD